MLRRLPIRRDLYHDQEMSNWVDQVHPFDIARAFPNTLLIVAIALVLALVTGIPMGVIAAIKPNGWVDKVVSMVASLGVAIPGFWLAMILVAEISLKLNWLPATGAKSFSASPR